MRTTARWCFEHRRWVLAIWLVTLVATVAGSSALGTKYNANYALPGTDSQAAVTLLKNNFPSVSGESDQVVIQATGGSTIRSADVRAAVTSALERVAKVRGVAGVVSPYSKAGAAQISRDGTIAFATVAWAMQPANVTKADAQRLITAAESADSAQVRISLGGQSIEEWVSSTPTLSVIVGVVAALIILLIVFSGAWLAALMPLFTAIVSLLVGISVIGMLSRVMDIPTVASDLAVLIGLGVGVDYGLFMISRHRTGAKAGMSFVDAIGEAATTSGRTVLFAGATVCIALLGQFALGVTFLNGLSVSSALAVALTMAASLTLLPAMLGFLGPRVLSRRERSALVSETAARSSDIAPFWLRWSRGVLRRHGQVGGAALVLVVLIGLPILGLRLGASDAATDPAGSITHQAYDAVANGFGPGFNGPLDLVAQTSSTADRAAFDRFLTTATHLHGVASVTPAAPSPNGHAAVAVLYPTTSPQASQTVSLVNRLRDDVRPAAERGTNLRIHIGGTTATNIDFASVLDRKIPIFIALVVILAYILLAAVFRSVLIPLVASVMNLLSVGAALGALNAVFNWGWGHSLMGVPATGPIAAFVPVLLFSILFGLSMDYEVYLVSRIHEEWQERQRIGSDHGAASPSDLVLDNHSAIVTGQAKAQPIIAAAAGIMILVFGSFLLANQLPLKEFGFGLGFAVLVDALLIRSLFVPAIMHQIGPANWYMPAWLDRLLPNLAIETADDASHADSYTSAGARMTGQRRVSRPAQPRP